MTGPTEGTDMHDTEPQEVRKQGKPAWAKTPRRFGSSIPLDTPRDPALAAEAVVEVEAVATAIARAVGSQVFEPLHDTAEHQAVRDQFRRLAQDAIAVNQAEVHALLTALARRNRQSR